MEELKEELVINGNSNNKLTPKQISAIVFGVVATVLVAIVISVVIVFVIDKADNKKIKYTYFTFGEEIEYKDLSFKVINYEISKYADGYYYSGDDNYWILVKVEVTNISNNSIDLSDYEAHILYGIGDNSAIYNSSYSYSDYFIQSSSDIMPFGSVSGVYAFRIPKKIIDNESDKINNSQIKLNEENNFYFNFLYSFQKNNIQELLLKL